MSRPKIAFGPDGYTPLPSGNYHAKVVRVILDCHGKFGKCIQIEFEIVGGKYADKPIGKRMKQGRVRDQLWRLVKILTGIEYDELSELDPDDLLHRECLLVIKHFYDETEKRYRSKVADFLPLDENKKIDEEGIHESGRLGS